jgi:hypothetical protein
MLYQLSYASPPSALHFQQKPPSNHSGKPPRNPRKFADTLALRAFFGTELKVSIAARPEQT